MSDNISSSPAATSRSPTEVVSAPQVLEPVVNDKVEARSRAEESPEAVVKWMVEVNARYVRLADLLIGLATGALVLPPVFLKTFLGVSDEPLAMFLTCTSIASMLSFAGSIFFGVTYHLLSAEWVKLAWRRPSILSATWLRRTLATTLALAILSFGAGLVLFVLFVRQA